MNKNGDIPEVLRYGTVEAKTMQQKANHLNEYFQSVYSQPSNISTRQTSDVAEGLVINLSVSKRIIRSILEETDETKSRRLDGIPPIFFKKLAEPMSYAFNTLFRTVKRLKVIPEDWKTGSISPIHKKGSRNAVETHRPVTLLNFASKTLEKCMNVPLYNHLATLVSNCQHGLIKNRSVISNLLSYLKMVSETLDADPKTESLAFYTDFAKAFDKVPHSELLHKLENMGVGGCFFQVLVDHLTNRKRYVRIGNCRSMQLKITSGVPQGLFLGPVYFCFFINDLPNAFRNSYTLLFADDLKFVTTTNNHVIIEFELKRFQRWNKENQMLLAEGKNGFLEFRGSNSNFELNTEILKPAKYTKDLGVFICPELTWNKHFDEKLKKAVQTLYFVKRNTSFQIKSQAKLCLFKSMILPIFTYASPCLHLSKQSQAKIEVFEKRVLKWVLADYKSPYRVLLEKSELLPLFLFLQILDLLHLSKLCENDRQILKLFEKTFNPRSLTFKLELPKVRTGKARTEFRFRTCRVANFYLSKLIFSIQ